jgi:chromodomain-helicase-DNA-binding protein 4
MTHYWRKFSNEYPPELEECLDDNDDLAMRFYRYGIKPEWLQIQRILNHELVSFLNIILQRIKFQCDNGVYDYLIKWRELNYDEATWESEQMNFPDLNEAINKYWVHR